MKRIALAAGAAALLLAGCTSTPPVVSDTPEPYVTAALTVDQAERIVEQSFDAMSIADAAADKEALSARFAGDALDVRMAEYAVAKADAEAAVSVLPADMQAVYLSGETGWPRVFSAVSEPADEASAPVVYLWVQDSIEEPYTLRGWAHMVPGAALPAMPAPVVGAAQVSMTEDGVDPSPRQALEDYVEYLRDGADSPFAANFGEDPYATQLFAARTALAKAANDAGGAYVDTIQPEIAETYTLSTADGGVLVFAPVHISSSFSVKDATLKLSARDGALLSGAVKDRATYGYRDLVVIHVPGPASPDLPSVVAAEHHLVQIKPE